MKQFARKVFEMIFNGFLMLVKHSLQIEVTTLEHDISIIIYKP